MGSNSIIFSNFVATDMAITSCYHIKNSSWLLVGNILELHPPIITILYPSAGNSHAYLDQEVYIEVGVLVLGSKIHKNHKMIKNRAKFSKIYA